MRYSGYQRTGSEYGGVAHTPSGIQPKPQEALNNTELLRLGYVTGVEDWQSIEDRRQMVGLRPANGGRPQYIGNLNSEDDPRLKPIIEDVIELYNEDSISLREYQAQQFVDPTWDDDV